MNLDAIDMQMKHIMRALTAAVSHAIFARRFVGVETVTRMMMTLHPLPPFLLLLTHLSE